MLKIREPAGCPFLYSIVLYLKELIFNKGRNSGRNFVYLGMENKTYIGSTQVKVEAIQWEGDIESQQQIEDFIGQELQEGESPDYLIMGDQVADIGDYFVKDSDGKFYISKQKQFEGLFGNKRL